MFTVGKAHTQLHANTGEWIERGRWVTAERGPCGIGCLRAVGWLVGRPCKSAASMAAAHAGGEWSGDVHWGSGRRAGARVGAGTKSVCRWPSGRRGEPPSCAPARACSRLPHTRPHFPAPVQAPVTEAAPGWRIGCVGARRPLGRRSAGDAAATRSHVDAARHPPPTLAPPAPRPLLRLPPTGGLTCECRNGRRWPFFPTKKKEKPQKVERNSVD